MHGGWIVTLGVAVISVGLGSLGVGPPAGGTPDARPSAAERIRLPAPRLDGDVSVERALALRRSIRDYRDTPLALADVSQLLWAAQGVTSPREGYRTAPSAGATYPLELYTVSGRIMGLTAGVYRYAPHQHDLVVVRGGDVRTALAAAALGQTFIEQAAIILVIAAVYERTTRRYGERGIRYVHMEAGHASQNVYLQAVALRLGTVVVGAFDDTRVQQILQIPAGEHPLYLMPVGRP
jgi:SagB-type dehydrogenase family enzyme